MPKKPNTRRNDSSPAGFLVFYSNIIYFILTVSLSAIIYRITLCPTVEYIDSGELALACNYLGIAHPTGYPLYTLLGRLATLFLWGDLIHKVNLLSLIFTSFAAGFLYLSIRQLLSLMKNKNGWGDFIPFSAALFASLTPIWWAQGTTNEVYSLNLMLISISLWSFFRYLNFKQNKWLVLSAYVLGLSLTNHLSALYIVPAFALLLIYLWRKRKLKGTSLIYPAIFFVLPLSIYLFLPIRARFSPFLNWGAVDNLYFLYKHISGWQYRVWMFTDFSLPGLIDKISSSVVLTFVQFEWAGMLLAAIGIFVLLARKTYIAVFAILVVALNFVYASNYEIVDIESYYLPTVIMLSIFMAVGIAYLAGVIIPVTRNSRPVKYVITAGIILLPISNLIDNFFVSDRSDKTFARQSVYDTINSMEQNGLAFIENWDFYSPWLYFHFEENLRPDIALLDKELMRRSWYIDFIKRQHPDIYHNSSEAIEEFLEEVRPFERSRPFDGAVIDRAYYNMLHTITRNETNRRPVYTNILADRKFLSVLPRIPSGILYRIEDSKDFVETERFHFKEELWGNRYIYRDRRIATILSYYEQAFSSREKYCRYFHKEDEAEFYKNMTAEVSAVIKDITRKK
jgi:hypothetical protein